MAIPQALLMVGHKVALNLPTASKMNFCRASCIELSYAQGACHSPFPSCPWHLISNPYPPPTVLLLQ